MLTIISLIAAYLIGSLSTSIILSKYLKFEDPRNTGSGNAGATNVLRSAGKKAALYVLAGDAAKGFIAVLLARLLGMEGAVLGLVALAAVLGHIFPVFFQFKGGKGVATALGTVFGLNLLIGFLLLIIWILVAYFSKYASLASIVAAVAMVLLVFTLGNSSMTLPCLFIAALIIWKHKDNIDRLKNKTESKIEL